MLSDPDTRARYDRFGHAGVDGPHAAHRPVHGLRVAVATCWARSSARTSVRRRQARTARGGDAAAAIELSLSEAAFGVDARGRRRGGRRAATTAAAAAPSRGTTPERCADLRRRGPRAAGPADGARPVRPMLAPARRAAAAASIIAHAVPRLPRPGRRADAAHRRRSPSRRASRTASGSACAARATPASPAPRPATSTCGVAVRARPALRARRRRPRLGGRPAVHAGRAGHRARRCRRWTATERIELTPGTQPGDVVVLRGKGIPHAARPRPRRPAGARQRARAAQADATSSAGCCEAFEARRGRRTPTPREDGSLLGRIRRRVPVSRCALRVPAGGGRAGAAADARAVPRRRRGGGATATSRAVAGYADERARAPSLVSRRAGRRRLGGRWREYHRPVRCGPAVGRAALGASPSSRRS